MAFKSRFCSTLVVGGLLALTGLAAQGQTQKVAYYTTKWFYTGGHIVEWNDTTGRAVNLDTRGAMPGGFTLEADGKRVLTYDRPFSSLSSDTDRCGQVVQTRRDVSQAIYRSLDSHRGIGKTQITHVITKTWLDGCDAGKTEQVPDDGTVPFLRHPLRIRTPIDDVTAGGVSLAGFAEQPIAVTDDGAEIRLTPVDTAALSGVPGSVTFEQSGNQYPVSLSAQGWLVISLPSGPRAYRRMAVDPKTGHEIWLMGDMQGDQLKWVTQVEMIKPQAGASFGTTPDIAHRWLSSIRFPGSRFGFALYADGTGDTCNKAPPARWGCGFPLTWQLDGTTLQFHQQRTSYERIRLWEPLARTGNKQWMYETLTYHYPDGSTQPAIVRRLNYYTDEGPSQPPAR